MTDFILISSCFLLMQYGNTDASKAAALKIYQERGIERNVNQYVDKFIDDGLKLKLGNLALVTKTLYDQKILYEVSF